MRKKRILWVNEASWKSTGYSTYAHEVLTRLNNIEHFEIAELACYVDRSDPQIAKQPWKVYPNRPLESDEDFKSYVDNPSRIFGEQTFNHVLIDFMPDIVMDIRDWWMFEYQQRSPFRDFFHWSIMPTVDAMPQNPQWINTFEDADAVFAYSEFGRDVMMQQSDQINFVDLASPAASETYQPHPNKKQHKDAMGLEEDCIILGTVMRNQRRKLYPDLFKVFRDILDKTKKSNLFLYCHTYYPDIGWEIPELLTKFGLTNRVLFSYRCLTCEKFNIDFYKDTVCYCHDCKELSNKLVGIENPVDNKQLSNIYNTFDIYVQYANSEGFGMPQLEAACCGLPVVSVDYSAMEAVIKNIGGTAIRPIGLSMECETGCYRAIPDNDHAVSVLESAINYKHLASPNEVAKIARDNYDWDKTAQVWIDHLESVPMKDHNKTWLSPARVLAPASDMPSEIVDLTDQISYMFKHVLHKPDWIGGYYWTKVIKDITFGYRVHNSEDDYYFNESHTPKVEKYQKFNMENAVVEMTNLRNMWNQLEQLRGQINAKSK